MINKIEQEKFEKFSKNDFNLEDVQNLLKCHGCHSFVNEVCTTATENKDYYEGCVNSYFFSKLLRGEITEKGMK